MSISKREKKVLGAIIDYYITEGSTVGSRTLVKKYELGVSSATVRNVMSDLEELGYLIKTHASSGRIPTSKSYKYYMKKLLDVRKLSQKEIKHINSIYEERLTELEEVLARTSSLLSKMSKYAGVVIEPDVNIELVKKIKLVHINDYLLMVVLVIGNSTFRNRKIHLHTPVEESKIPNITKKLNNILQGKELYKVVTGLEKLINKIIGSKNSKDKLEQIEKKFKSGFYLEGATNIIRCIEQDDPEDIVDVVEFLEGRKDVRDIFESIAKDEKYDESKVNIVLGEDLGIKGIEDLSFIFSTYQLGKSKGVVGIIGPKRMEYSKTASLVKHVVDEVNKIVKTIDYSK
ncbi:MAG: heat-inducible transcriptional repressor HrcA [Fusobacteriota bacterium]